jgi:hypothetical protein
MKTQTSSRVALAERALILACTRPRWNVRERTAVPEPIRPSKSPQRHHPCGTSLHGASTVPGNSTTIPAI